MGLIESWQQNRERIAQGVGDSVTKVREKNLIVDGATKVACYIAEFHPDNYNQTTPFLRALIDSTCRAINEPGLLPRPEPQFNGGQCDTFDYTVTVTFDRFFNGDFVQEQTFVFNAVPGAVLGAVARQTPNDPRLIEIHVISSNPPANPAVTDRPIGGAGISAEITNVTVEPADSSDADICGDPKPPDRPPTGDVPPEEKRFTVNFDGDDVTFDLDLDSMTGTSLTFVNNDFDVTINLDGFSTDDSDTSSGGGGAGGAGGDGTTSEEEEPRFRSKKTFKPEELEETPVGIEVEEVEEEDETIEFVTVTVVGLPDSGRTYVSQNPEDIHMNAAYLRWTGAGEGAGFSYPDIAIRRLQTVHRRPDEAGGYRVYAVNGATISVSTYSEIVGDDE